MLLPGTTEIFRAMTWPMAVALYNIKTSMNGMNAEYSVGLVKFNLVDTERDDSVVLLSCKDTTRGLRLPIESPEEAMSMSIMDNKNKHDGLYYLAYENNENILLTGTSPSAGIPRNVKRPNPVETFVSTVAATCSMIPSLPKSMF